MVAYVMDDERVIKSAWTPEVRAALDDGDANVFLSLSSSSPRPRSRRRRDARARPILGLASTAEIVKQQSRGGAVTRAR
jgi:hypothetical protein